MANLADLEYLRKQKASKSANYANGTQIVGQGTDPLNDTPNTFYWLQDRMAPQQQEQSQAEPQEEGNFWSDTFGFIDELAAQFGAGFVGAFEGIADLAATGLGALGDATGWYDSTPFTDWASIDYASKAAEWTKTYGNFTPWGLVNSFKKLDDENYRRNFLGALFGGPLAAGIQTFRNDTDDGSENYGYGKNVLARTKVGDFELGNFLGGAANSIGFMIPSIMTGGATAAGTGSAVLGKAASLTSMGLSAAGKGSEEALNDGADASGALASGAVSGAIEVGTELIPWPGGNSFGGIMTGSTAKKIGVKGFVKNMVEEGLEEIISGSLDPVKKYFYKGEKAFDEYKDPEFWIGGKNKGFSESVLGQGISGAFVGGIMGAGSTLSEVKKYGGVKQYNAVAEYRASLLAEEEVLNDVKKGKLTVSEAQQILSDNAKYMKKNVVPNLEEYFKDEKFRKGLFGNADLTEEDFDKIKARLEYAEEGANPGTYKEYLDDFYSKKMEAFKAEITADGWAKLNEYFSAEMNAANKNVKAVLFMPSENFRYTDADGKVKESKAFHQDGRLYINQRYADKFSNLMFHEGIVHAILDMSQEVRNALESEAEKMDKDFGKNDQSILDAYKDQGITRDSDLFHSERLAHYLESQLITPEGVMRLAQGKFNVIDALKRVFKYAKDSRQLRLMRKVANAVRAVESAKEAGKLQKQTAGARASKNIEVSRKNSDKHYSKTLDSKSGIFDGLNLKDPSKAELDNIKSVFLSAFNAGMTWESQEVAEAMNKMNDANLEAVLHYLRDKGVLPSYDETEFDELGDDTMDELMDELEEEIDEWREENSEDGKRKRTEEQKQIRREEWESLSDEEKRFLSFEKAYNRDYQKLVRVLNLKMSEQAKEYFKDSVLKGGNPNVWNVPDGMLVPMFHGTPSPDMFEFDPSRIGENGTQRGYGFYLTDSLDFAKGYKGEDGKVILAFVNITNPVPDSKYKSKITKEMLGKFIKKHIDSTAEMGFLSDWGDVSRTPYNKILQKYLDSAFEYNNTDWDILTQLYHDQNDVEFEDFFKAVKDDFGYDGYIAWNRADGGTIAVAFNSNQIKDVSNMAPTSSPDIRYSRNLEYSDNEDSDGETLTIEQNEYFKDSKFRDEDGRLLRLYHGSDSAGFMRFNEYEESMGDFKPIFLTDDFERAGSYTRTINPVVTKTFDNADDLLEYFNGDEASDELHLFDADGYTYDAGRVSDDSGAVKEAKRQLGIWENILKSSTITDEQRKLAEKRVADFKKVVNGEDGYFLEEYDSNSRETNYFIYPTEKDLIENLIPDVQDTQNMNANIDSENNDFESDEKEPKTNNVYAVYVNAKNPLVVNCKGNNFNWIQFEGKRMSTDDIAVLAHERGYDGVIFKNVMDNGSRDLFNDLGRANIYVAFNSNQVKAVDNYEPTGNPDIRYSRSLNDDEFVSIESTKNIVSDSKNYIERYLLDRFDTEFTVRYPVNFDSFSDTAFSKINSAKQTKTQAKRIANAFAEMNVERAIDGGKGYEYVGELGDLISEKSVNNLAVAIEDIISSEPNSQARSKATRNFEKQLNKALDTASLRKDGLSRTRVLTRLRDNARKTVDRYVEVTDNVKAREGLYALLNFATELHGAANDAFEARGVKERVGTALEWYNEEELAKKFPDIPYYPEVRRALEDLYDSLGDPVEVEIKKGPNAGKKYLKYGNLTTDSMRSAIQAIRVIKAAINDMQRQYVREVRPSVDQTLKALDRRGTKGFVGRLMNAYKRGFAPAYVVLEDMLGGNSALASLLTYEMQDGLNSKTLYVGEYSEIINEKLKELGIRKNFDSKTFEVLGNTLTADQALHLYISLNVEANFNAINDSGVEYINSKDLLTKLVDKGQAQELKDAIEKALPDNYKKLGDFLLETINGSVKKEFMLMHDSRFGKYNHRNEIGVVGDKSYWMMFRSYQKTSNIEKAVRNPAGMFSHAESRVNNQYPILVAGALSSFTAYIDQLGSELYVKPLYRKAIAMLNTKGTDGRSVSEVLRQNNQGKDIRYLSDTLADLLGANPYGKANDVFSKAMSAFSVAKLSLNVGTMAKQFASIWTSNIPMRKSLKAFFSNIFKPANVRSEYKLLIEGEKNEKDGSWNFEPLGGLKYREATKGVLRANADSAGALTQKIASVGMIGISKVDLFTVSTGAVALMHIAQDQFNYKIGTKENAQWVKEHWSEFELSQIGNGALSKNAIARGDYTSLARAVFGFMQGANRAALGSLYHKLGLWNRNKGKTRVSLENQKSEAKAKMDKARVEYEADPSKENATKYAEARADYLDADYALKDFDRYKAAGGRAIPLNAAAGLLTQGVFIAIINQLMQILKGKKDKDEWDIIELSYNSLMGATLNWTPLLNVFTNYIGTFSKKEDGTYGFGKGFDISVPALDILNSFGDIVDYFKTGNTTAALRSLGFLAGDLTGIPAQLLYQYLYGITKLANPNAADMIQSFVYPGNVGYAKVSSAIADGHDDIALRAINSIAEKNVGKVSDPVAQEILFLAKNEQNVLPSALPKKWTDEKGAEKQISWTEQQNANKVYSMANAVIAKAIETSYYKKLSVEQKAAVIKGIYSAYRQAALHSSVQGYDGPLTKLGTLAMSKSGSLSSIFVAVYAIRGMEDTKTKTRKQQAVEYVNRLRMSKNDRLLTLYIAGFSVDKNAVISALRQKGFTNKEAKAFVE